MIPRPAFLQPLPDALRLTADTVLAASGEAAPVAERLAAALRGPTGFALPVLPASDGPAICLECDPGVAGAEAYRLRIERQGVLLSAATPHGLTHAMHTLLQLWPPEVHAGRPLPGADWALPGLLIEDAPRFAWRDLMLDCSRHLMPIGFLRRLIDLMAMHKLNRFHWHLTDDQGWRIEIRKYPRLTDVGAWRRRTQLGHKQDRPTRYDDRPHGGYYTQIEIRELVAYAAARHIEIVPEIDMPGHVQAALAAYPELGSGEPVEVSDRWLISQHVLFPRESTISFMQDVLSEVMELFPSRYIHIGGDECDKTEWRASVEAQALIQQHGLGDESGLQSWFIRRMASFLQAHGRVLVGWDEILEGGLPPGAVVMSWRGMQGGIAGAQAGHDVIMTPNTHVYLDYHQGTDADEPLAIRGPTTLRTTYDFEPVPPDLTGALADHVLGTGAKLWTEYVASEAHAAYMLLPRLCALAEVAWTPPALRDFGDFRARMELHERRLAAFGWHGRPLGPVTT